MQNTTNFVVVTAQLNSYAYLFVKQMAENGKKVIVIHNTPAPRSLKRFASKLFKTGLLGAIFGYRFRKAYQHSFGNVKELCAAYQVPFFELSNFDKSSVSNLDTASWTVGLSLGNGYIPKRFFSLFQYGMINVHHEILPDYPGAQSVVWPIIEMKRETGFSMHKINQKIDQGELLLVVKRPIEFRKSLFKTVAHNYQVSLLASVDSLVNLCEKHPSQWTFAHNSTTNYYTSPTFGQWMKAYRNHSVLEEKYEVEFAGQRNAGEII